MAVQFEVNVQQLTHDIERARGCLRYLNNNLNSMFGEIKELDTMWDGTANDAFNIQFNNDYEMMKDVIKNLRKLIESLEFAKSEYIKCENQVGSAIRALKF
ncbi:MAG: WXG100 family type VII secretion target [Eubacterium sp.]|nr:WXG100 family type VII secretion target [Eubacterium sp.]